MFPASLVPAGAVNVLRLLEVNVPGVSEGSHQIARSIVAIVLLDHNSSIFACCNRQQYLNLGDYELSGGGTCYEFLSVRFGVGVRIPSLPRVADQHMGVDRLRLPRHHHCVGIRVGAPGLCRHLHLEGVV